MKKHTSKLDLWIPILLLLVFGFAITDLLFKGEWIGVLVMSGILCLVMLFITNVSYSIDKQMLTLKNVFHKKIINISSIRKITQTNTILSTPFATSWERLEISYNEYSSVMISPKNKEKFIADLLKINPNISVEKEIKP